MREQISSVLAASSILAVGACLPTGGWPDPDTRPPKPEDTVSDDRHLVEMRFYDGRVPAINAARQRCGLPFVGMAGRARAEREMKVKYFWPDPWIRWMTYECPEPGKDAS